MGARLLLLSFDCPAVAGGRRSRLSAVPRMSSGAPLVRPPASSVCAFAVTAARGNLPHHTSVVVEGGGVYTVGDFMTKREQLHVVKPSTSVDEALERLVEHRITGFPVTDDHWNLVGVVSDYDLLALDSISGNGQAEADIFPEVDSTWKVHFERLGRIIDLIVSHGYASTFRTTPSLTCTRTHTRAYAYTQVVEVVCHWMWDDM
ncbi:CBS domain-containing protein CBSX2, chloroplastic-like isoform X1 [Triticum dicoccoides]|uniref:CBS domain-containing protein CBSX2, chloroplastic-like isoform X1 n=1 Tax=Triticum dicoccoides TaxID=85692 RepID=UPI0008444735|nr:CBS domain-containing protein CBSX2, chloroplastic-like isoform X1 [Triticum dicoccoides]XP_044432674.1 CBS domain-containing protein CBSX2, chloroplastic-like isoform X1 [Triticum aestivum]